MYRKTIACGVAMVLAAASAVAQEPSVAGPSDEMSVASDTDKQNWSDLDTILRNSVGHPNETWRLHGADAASRGSWKDAAGYFRRAARYADKYSQHRLSLMYWHGVGVPLDHALGYAWADLAAERRYPQFVLLREKMWAQLDEAERASAVAQGQAIYDEFGDAVAKKRFAVAVGRVKRQTSGSHTGSTTGPLQVQSPAPGGDPRSPLGGRLAGGVGGPSVSKLYTPKRWDIDHYWKLEDALWTGGSVDVGPLERVGGAPPPATPAAASGD